MLGLQKKNGAIKPLPARQQSPELLAQNLHKLASGGDAALQQGLLKMLETHIQAEPFRVRASLLRMVMDALPLGETPDPHVHKRHMLAAALLQVYMTQPLPSAKALPKAWELYRGAAREQGFLADEDIAACWYYEEWHETRQVRHPSLAHQLQASVDILRRAGTQSDAAPQLFGLFLQNCAKSKKGSLKDEEVCRLLLQDSGRLGVTLLLAHKPPEVAAFLGRHQALGTFAAAPLEPAMRALAEALSHVVKALPRPPELKLPGAVGRKAKKKPPGPEEGIVAAPAAEPLPVPVPDHGIAAVQELMQRVFNVHVNPDLAAEAAGLLCNVWCLVSATWRQELLQDCAEPLGCFENPLALPVQLVGLLMDLENAHARVRYAQDLCKHFFVNQSLAAFERLKRKREPRNTPKKLQHPAPVRARGLEHLYQHIVYDGYTGAALGFARGTRSFLCSFLRGCTDYARHPGADAGHLVLASVLAQVQHWMDQACPLLRLEDPSRLELARLHHTAEVACAVKNHWWQIPHCGALCIFDVVEQYWSKMLTEVELLWARHKKLHAEGKVDECKQVKQCCADLQHHLNDVCQPFKRRHMLYVLMDVAQTGRSEADLGAYADRHDVLMEECTRLQNDGATCRAPPAGHWDEDPAGETALFNGVTQRLTAGFSREVRMQRHDISGIKKLLDADDCFFKLLQTQYEGRVEELSGPPRHHVADLLWSCKVRRGLGIFVRRYLCAMKEQRLKQPALGSEAVHDPESGASYNNKDTADTNAAEEICQAWDVLCLQGLGHDKDAVAKAKALCALLCPQLNLEAPTFLNHYLKEAKSLRALPNFPGRACAQEGPGQAVRARESLAALLLSMRNLRGFFSPGEHVDRAFEQFRQRLQFRSVSRLQACLKHSQAAEPLRHWQKQLEQQALRTIFRQRYIAPWDSWRRLSDLGFDDSEAKQTIFIFTGGTMSILCHAHLSLDVNMRQSSSTSAFYVFLLKHQKHVCLLPVPYQVSAATLVAAFDDLVADGAEPCTIFVLDTIACVRNRTVSADFCCGSGLNQSIRLIAVLNLDDLLLATTPRSSGDLRKGCDPLVLWRSLAAVAGLNLTAIQADFPPAHRPLVLLRHPDVPPLSKHLLQIGVRGVLFSRYPPATVRLQRLVVVPLHTATQEICQELQSHGVACYGYGPGIARMAYGISTFKYEEHVLQATAALWDAELYGRSRPEQSEQVRQAVAEALSASPPALHLTQVGCRQCLLVTYELDVQHLEDLSSGQGSCHILVATPQGLPTSRSLAEVSCSEMRRGTCEHPGCRALAERGCPLVLRRVTLCREHASDMQIVSIEEYFNATDLRAFVADARRCRCSFDGCSERAASMFAHPDHAHWCWCAEHTQVVLASMQPERFCRSGRRWDGMYCDCAQCIALEHLQRYLHGHRHIAWPRDRPVLTLQPPLYYQMLHRADEPPTYPRRSLGDLRIGPETLEWRQNLEAALVAVLSAAPELRKVAVVIVEDEFLELVVRPCLPQCGGIVRFDKLAEDTQSGRLGALLEQHMRPDACKRFVAQLNELTAVAKAAAPTRYPPESAEVMLDVIPADFAPVAHPHEMLAAPLCGVVALLVDTELRAHKQQARRLLARLRQVMHHLGLLTHHGPLVRVTSPEHDGLSDFFSWWHVCALCAFDAGARQLLTGRSKETSVLSVFEQGINYMATVCLTGQVAVAPLPVLAQTLCKLKVLPSRHYCGEFLARINEALKSFGLDKREELEGLLHSFNRHLPSLTPSEAFFLQLSSHLEDQRKLQALGLLSREVVTLQTYALHSARFHLDGIGYGKLLDKLATERQQLSPSIFDMHFKVASKESTAQGIAEALLRPA